MTKKEFDEKYVGKKLVVHCKTEELANEFLKLADGFGYRWCNGDCYVSDNSYDSYGEDTCYRLVSGSYANLDFYEQEGNKIVEFKSYKTLYKISDVGRMFTTYSDFFFHTGNQNFVSKYDYNRMIDHGTIVEIVGSGKHRNSGYPELFIVHNPKTDKVYITQMDGLEPVKPEPVYPKGVKSVVVDGNLTTVTLDDGRVGYAKCSGVDKPDSVVGFSVAFAKGMTGMSAKELRECLPTTKTEVLELCFTNGVICGTVGEPTQLKDSHGKKLYVGDIVSIKSGSQKFENSVIAKDSSGCEYAMGIMGAMKPNGNNSHWDVGFVESYNTLKPNTKTVRGIEVRVKK